MDGHKVKFKRVDTGKYWIAGSVKVGQYGPQIGMKKSAELKAYLDSIPDGGWINLSIDKPYEQKEPRSAAAKSQPREADLDDEIPFALLLPAIGISSLLVSNFQELLGYAQGLVG